MMFIEKEIQRNKSQTFFLPIFNRYVPISHFNLLMNTYFWYEDISEETFCLLYKFDGKVRGEFNNRSGFTVYEHNTLTKSPLFRGYRDYDQFVIYEYDLPEDLYDIRNTIIEGKYSKLDDDCKRDIINFTFHKFGLREKNYIEKILTRDAGMRQALAEKLGYKSLPEDTELTSSPYIENEIFKNTLKREK